MLSYHSDPAIKSRYLARVEGHAAADEILKGRYWEAGKGCAVGCTVHGADHESFEQELGIPRMLAWLEDIIFEGLPTVIIGVLVIFILTDKPEQASFLTREEKDWLGALIQRERRTDDRPQPRLDRMRGKGMAATVGRLRPCSLLDWKFTVLSHNTIRGGAGAAVLNGEFLAALGKLVPADASHPVAVPV